jgi:hypothetical protein
VLELKVGSWASRAHTIYPQVWHATLPTCLCGCVTHARLPGKARPGGHASRHLLFRSLRPKLPIVDRLHVTQQSLAGECARKFVQCHATYVPSPLDPALQASQTAVAVFIVSCLPAAWWLIVVPSSRKKLARDKRRGAPSNQHVGMWHSFLHSSTVHCTPTHATIEQEQAKHPYHPPCGTQMLTIVFASWQACRFAEGLPGACGLQRDRIDTRKTKSSTEKCCKRSRTCRA